MQSRQSTATRLAVAFLAFGLFLSAARPAEAFLDKTRFAAHLGIAYFCFHHWVMKPYGEGQFVSGAPHRTSALVKGGVALLFAVHEVQVAAKIARLSKDPLLQKLSGSVGTLTNSFASVGQRLKGGKFSPDDVKMLDSATSTVGAQAAAGGAPIKDVPVPIPGG